jgi:hypothetical protein
VLRRKWASRGRVNQITSGCVHLPGGVQLHPAQEWFAEGNWNRGAVGVTVASAECVMTDESGVLVATATSTLLISDVKPA